jgi:hypothetical protein
MSFEGTKSRNLTVLFGIAAAAIVGFFAISMFMGAPIIRDTTTEETEVIASDNNVCVVETMDSIMSSKTISDCNLEVGAKVKITYKNGLPTATIESP